MPELSTIPPELSPEDKICFVEHHRVSLDSGDYQITVKQTINFDGKSETFTAKQGNFSIQGERFTLNPQAIHAVLPPKGSQGDFWHVFPHVILNRSTLPWERSAEQEGDDTEKDPPWLLLLLFDEQEAPATQVISLEKLKMPTSSPNFPGITLETGQHDDDQVMVIDLPYSLCSTLVPPMSEPLKYLTHARWVKPPDKPTELREELAVIIGNRLPKSGSRNVVHLVSIEDRYKNGKLNAPKGTDSIRFISLMSWEFFCISPEKNFKGLLEHLNLADDGKEISASLRLPTVNEPSAQPGKDANDLLSQGFVPLPHFFRQGDRSVSLYRGPLVPNPLEVVDVGLPTQASDHLLRVYSDFGLLDVSYAMAWELGRMLTLQNTRIALQLFNWKRQHAQDLRATRHLVDYGYDLPMKRAKEQKPQTSVANENQSYFPDAIQKWFDELSKLCHVPFNYLVADDRLLPPESLRFFSVDNTWLNCLRDGAFSIGRVLELDYQQDSRHAQASPDSSAATSQIAGLLLRSEVVSGWPGLQIDAYSVSLPAGSELRDDSYLNEKDYPKLPCLRMERLSNDVLIALFDVPKIDVPKSSNKSIQMVDMHLRPETLHFGFDVPGGNQADLSKLIKHLRSNKGEQISVFIKESETGINQNTRVVDVVSLAENIFQKIPQALKGEFKSLGADVFALEMVAGIEMIRFIRQPST